MTPRDPLVDVWNALDAHGCNPFGNPSQFSASCPIPDHEDRSPSLRVGTGSHGQALLCCHGCHASYDRIAAAIGMTVTDLWPEDCRNGRRLRGVAPPIQMADLVLRALKRLDIDYRRTLAPDPMWAADFCPICQRADKWPLWLGEDYRKRFYITCAGGCEQITVLDALGFFA
ncbi:MAG: hypothetical protein ACXVHB_28830 [Solirubrobacteraceae bacterium]